MQVKQYKDGTSNVISTVAKNRIGDIPCANCAKEARKLYHIVGTQTLENSKSLLRMNIIKHCTVTPKDVNIAEKIFGPDVYQV